MSVYKNTKTNTWMVYYRYTDWQGQVKQTTKREPMSIKWTRKIRKNWIQLE